MHVDVIIIIIIPIFSIRSKNKNFLIYAMLTLRSRLYLIDCVYYSFQSVFSSYFFITKSICYPIIKNHWWRTNGWLKFIISLYKFISSGWCYLSNESQTTHRSSIPERIKIRERKWQEQRIRNESCQAWRAKFGVPFNPKNPWAL